MPPFLLVLSRSFDFDGRSARREFWWFTVVDLLLLVLLSILDALSGTLDLSWGFGLLGGCYFLLTLPARLSLVVRRLHDQGQSGAAAACSHRQPRVVPGDRPVARGAGREPLRAAERVAA
jgi:uncharacterized membrane protein YhaH (DUF805 family)